MLHTLSLFSQHSMKASQLAFFSSIFHPPVQIHQSLPIRLQPERAFSCGAVQYHRNLPRSTGEAIWVGIAVQAFLTDVYRGTSSLGTGIPNPKQTV
jgi:hypothetical protein